MAETAATAATTTEARTPTAAAPPGPGAPVPGLPRHEAAPTAGQDVVAQVEEILARARSLPVDEHVAAYDEVHALLQQELARLDEG